MLKSNQHIVYQVKSAKSRRHIIVVWVDNEAGVLARIAGLFSGRGYNIESLAVAEVDKKNIYQELQLLLKVHRKLLNKLNLQLKKLYQYIK